MEEMMVNSLTSFSYNVFKSFRLFRSFRLGLCGKYHSLTHYQTTNFADDNFKFHKNGRKLSKWVENTVGKGEIARYEQFLLFQQCFQKSRFPGGVKRCHCVGMVNPFPNTSFFGRPKFKEACRRQIKSGY